MGLVKHRRGSIRRIAGEELVRMPDPPDRGGGRAALVPEGRRLFLNQWVEDNLLLGALSSAPGPESAYDELLESVYELFPAPA